MGEKITDVETLINVIINEFENVDAHWLMSLETDKDELFFEYRGKTYYLGILECSEDMVERRRKK